MKKMIFIIAAVLLIVAGIYIFTDSRELTQNEIDKNKIQAQTIINAIETFKKENKIYPEALQNIVPKYLEILPVCVNCEWKYYKKTFAPQYDVGFLAYHYWYYNSDTKVWVYDSM